MIHKPVVDQSVLYNILYTYKPCYYLLNYLFAICNILIYNSLIITYIYIVENRNSDFKYEIQNTKCISNTYLKYFPSLIK